MRNRRPGRRGRCAIAFSALALCLFSPSLTFAAPAQRIADLWYAHNAVLVMMGAADKVTVTVASPQGQPWMFRVAPSLSRARRVANGPANAETLMADRIDIAFVSQEAEATRLSRLGLHALKVDFNDLPTMRASLRATAAAIGTPLASARERAYEGYLDTTINKLRAGLAGLQPNQKPRVLHLASLTPLRADGKGTLIDTWINLTGGRNAADGLKGNLQPISPEQIARWNPDIVIVGGPAASAADRSWERIAALRGRRVVRNPLGVFPWDRYGPEFALQLQWTAKLLHPGRFEKLDMARESMTFYRGFFGYPLSMDEYRRINAALPPH